MTTNYSVECALPYDDDLESQRAKFGLALAGLVRKLEAAHQTYNRVLLVDDITNTGGKDYNLEAYTKAASGEEQGHTLIMRESMLDAVAAAIYGQLKAKMTSEELQKLKSLNGYSSPFYIAVWTLLRLGYIHHDEFPTERVAEKIVNILPQGFREGEAESMAIIGQTQFTDIADKVEYIYI